MYLSSKYYTVYFKVKFRNKTKVVIKNLNVNHESNVILFSYKCPYKLH